MQLFPSPWLTQVWSNPTWQLHHLTKKNTVPPLSHSLCFHSLCQRCWSFSKQNKVPGSLALSAHAPKMAGLPIKRFFEVYPEEVLKLQTMFDHKSHIHYKVLKLIPLGKCFMVILLQFNSYTMSFYIFRYLHLTVD